ncbi:MAG: trimethylamine methyltransferase family protein [Deltaproteobacteria bacterium]|nr:trimethylamine methyltransferase family protein [Deltaproteobacteria bacterium]MBW1956572.1 trimethylamine methyltransferase family protein [Deltaproteobacteria bacterium]MBW2042105.1 trimethylamine methyltransferase family protein [Deltaproteobacteria bacterium]MBW2132598.1 trimethylamine methyltransferase family protein [Deltaproteobacteria bacterium]
METRFRPGTRVKPYERLDADQIQRLHKASLRILNEPGIWCHNARAAALFDTHGARVWEEVEYGQTVWRVSLPAGLVEEAVQNAPKRFVLGARNPENRLELDARVPRVYFGSGSEANVWLETRLVDFTEEKDPTVRLRLPRFQEKRGTAALLGRAAHLCEHLEHLDFFIRPLNIQDPEIDADNHDVNKFFASLNNITKHVQAGLTKRERLPDVVHMAQCIAGGKKALEENPIISFIACLFKSPLQIVDDTAEKVFDIVNAGLPLVISSSPQGGSSAPIQEVGMVAQINAEILAGVTLTQLIREGAPVMYGSVPVRARMDDLHDLYGCPEFNQYNIDCAQLARFYEIPCYSTAGVGDAKVPGPQALFEKLFTHLYMGMSGAQYIHYAFGLLDRTNTFCPVQAVIDNEMIGKVKHCLQEAKVGHEETDAAVAMVNKVMASSHRLFARHARKAIHAGEVSEPFRFESKDRRDRVIEKALERMTEIEKRPPSRLPEKIIDAVYTEVPGLLPGLRGDP